MMLKRRGFITGLGAALIAAPAIVRASSLMPVSVITMRSASVPLDLAEELMRRLAFADEYEGSRWTHIEDGRSLIQRRLVVATPVPVGAEMAPSPPAQLSGGEWPPASWQRPGWDAYWRHARAVEAARGLRAA